MTEKGEANRDGSRNVREPWALCLGSLRAKIQVCAERCVCTADQPQIDQKRYGLKTHKGCYLRAKIQVCAEVRLHGSQKR
jgi:hypothetical protein